MGGKPRKRPDCPRHRTPHGIRDELACTCGLSHLLREWFCLSCGWRMRRVGAQPPSCCTACGSERLDEL